MSNASTLEAEDRPRLRSQLERIRGMSEKAKELLQYILDRHTSQKNAMTYGKGPACECQDCKTIIKVLSLEGKR